MSDSDGIEIHSFHVARDESHVLLAEFTNWRRGRSAPHVSSAKITWLAPNCREVERARTLLPTCGSWGRTVKPFLPAPSWDRQFESVIVPRVLYVHLILMIKLVLIFLWVSFINSVSLFTKHTYVESFRDEVENIDDWNVSCAKEFSDRKIFLYFFNVRS